MDPFLNTMDKLFDTPGRSTTRACADDVAGGASQALSFLKLYEKVFLTSEEVALLSLKAKKCVLVLLAEAYLDVAVQKVRSWLARHLATWEGFTIAPAAT